MFNLYLRPTHLKCIHCYNYYLNVILCHSYLSLEEEQEFKLTLYEKLKNFKINENKLQKL